MGPKGLETSPRALVPRVETYPTRLLASLAGVAFVASTLVAGTAGTFGTS
jgi:hypothetical protein